MIILLSPTKQMDFVSPLPIEIEDDVALFENEALKLNLLLKKFDQVGLAALMKISSDLADQTFERIQDFGSPQAPRRPAGLAYSGTVFQALDPGSFTVDQLEFAQRQLLILSGMYGVLRPLDHIVPYRLEMKTPLVLPGDERLNSFWKPRITEYLKSRLTIDGDESIILNLSSGEYSRVLDQKAFRGRVLNIHFKEKQNGKLRTVGMYAKTARGLMARRIIAQKIINPEALQKGSTGGYRYTSNLSNSTDWIFVRKTS